MEKHRSANLKIMFLESQCCSLLELGSMNLNQDVTQL